MPYPNKVTGDEVVAGHPDVQVEPGLDVEYTMLRGIFMPAGVTQEQVDYYVDIFKKVRETARVEEVHRGRARSTRRS